MDSKPEPSKLGAVPKAGSSGAKKRKLTSQSPEYSEHDSETYDYYTHTMSKGFQKDCEEFLAAFAKLESTRFKTFTNYWAQTAFSSAFTGGAKFRTNHLQYLASSFFQVIRKFLIYSKNIYVKVGALYLLNEIYSAQKHNNERVQICLTGTELENISEMIKKTDAVDIFYTLLSEEAFQFGSLEEHLRLDPRFVWHKNLLEDDIFKATEEPKETLADLTEYGDSFSDDDDETDVFDDDDHHLDDDDDVGDSDLDNYNVTETTSDDNDDFEDESDIDEDDLDNYVDQVDVDGLDEDETLKAYEEKSGERIRIPSHHHDDDDDDDIDEDDLNNYVDQVDVDDPDEDETLKEYEEKSGERIRIPSPEENDAEQIAAQKKAIREEFRLQESDSDKKI